MTEWKDIGGETQKERMASSRISPSALTLILHTYYTLYTYTIYILLEHFGVHVCSAPLCYNWAACFLSDRYNTLSRGLGLLRSSRYCVPPLLLMSSFHLPPRPPRVGRVPGPPPRNLRSTTATTSRTRAMVVARAQSRPSMPMAISRAARALACLEPKGTQEEQVSPFFSLTPPGRSAVIGSRPVTHRPLVLPLTFPIMAHPILHDRFRHFP